MEYAQKRVSPLLAQILARMQQNQQFQPQSYGALAAGLGASYLDKRSMDKALQQEQAKQLQGNTLLADMLTGRPAPKYEDPAQGPLVQLAQPQDTMAKLLETGGPELLGTGLDLQRAMAPQEAESPFSKIDPSKFTPESVAQFQGGGGKDYSVLKAVQAEDSIPADIKIAQFLYPGDEAAQRKYLQTKSPADTPMQIQLAMWATDGDATKARALVLKGLEKGDDKLSLPEIMAPIVQKMADGKPLSAGEKAAMDWYKQNPFAALMALLGAQAGSKVED